MCEIIHVGSNRQGVLSYTCDLEGGGFGGLNINMYGLVMSLPCSPLCVTFGIVVANLSWNWWCK